MKQEKIKTKFIKDPEEETSDYIFQKNKKTKTGATFITIVLVLIILAIITSAYYFFSSSI